MPSASTGSESFPCRSSTWPSRSFACVRGSTSVVSPVTGPERTRKQLMRPVNGSAIVLKMNTACFASPNSIVVPFFAGDGHALDEQVEERGRAEILRRDAARDRIELVARHRLLERVGDRVRVELLAFEVAPHQLLVGLDHRVEQLLAVLLHEIGHRVGNRLRAALSTARRIHVRAHVEEVDDSGQLVLAADRELDRDAAVRRAAAARASSTRIEVGALAVEHVDEDDARELLLVGALPDASRVDLDAHDAAEDDDDSFDDPQRRERVGLEARVAGRVDEVDLAVFPLEVTERAREGHPALLLVLVPVGDGRALLDGAEPVRLPGLEEQRLDERRLPDAAVSGDGDVADLALARWQASGTCPPRSTSSPHRIAAFRGEQRPTAPRGRRPTRCAP